MVVDLLQRAVLLQELGRRLLTHPSHAGYVVRHIPHQGLVIHELFRLQSISLVDALLVVGGGVGELAAGDEDPRVLINELEGVSVSGDDEHSRTLRLSLVG